MSTKKTPVLEYLLIAYSVTHLAQLLSNWIFNIVETRWKCKTRLRKGCL